MSSTQSRLGRTESQQYRNSGRSNRNYTGGRGSKASGTGSGVGATAAAPSSVNSNSSSTNKPALSSNRSFKKHNNVQRGQQPRGGAASGVALNSNSGTGQRPLQHGADLQQPSHGTSDPPVRNAAVNPAAVKPSDVASPKASRAPRAPPSIVSADNNDYKPPTTPVAPAKAPADASFSRQFGSISPRYMNGMQVSFLSPGAPVHDKEVVLASSQTSPIENLKGEDESVHHNGAGVATSLSSDVKEKSSQESHVVKSPVPEKKWKKKRKELLKNIDNNAPTSDLYLASSQTSPIENLKGEDDSVHHNGVGAATSLSADVKEKSSQESHVVKSPVPEKKGKKNRKELLKNIDNNAPTSDLYLASSQTSPIENLKGEDESVHHNGSGVATSLSSDVKEKSSQESHVVKSPVPEKKWKKKRKELLKNIDNNAPTSDLYLASSQTSPIENLKGEDDSVHHNGVGAATSLSADVKEKSSQESHVVKSPVPEKKGKKKRKELLKNIDNNAPTSDLYLASSQTSPIENLKGEDESVHHNGSGVATSLSSDVKEKSSQESHVVKSPVPEKKWKKKRKELLKNIDNNAPTSDLYLASSQTSPIGEDESVHHNGVGVATSLSADVKEKSSQESHVVKSPVPEKKGKKKRKELLKNIDNNAPTSDLYLASSQTSPIENLKGESESVHHNNADSDRWLRGTSFQKGLMPSPQTPLQMMHKTDNKYEVGKVSDEEQAKQRQLKAILKKLTPQNFEKLFEQVKQVNIDNVVTLCGVVSQIFDKALMEPTFCEVYANFCYHLSQELPDLSVDNQKITFKRLLLNKCQEEFERGGREQEEANKADDEGTVNQTEAEREEKRLKARRRMLGNIRLIGELYKKKMLTERIMHECIKKLLGQYQNPDEEDVEALCELMSTIGEMIDHPKAKEHMDVYFDMMFKLSNNMKLSSRVRFMLKDAIDLRRNKWQQRRKVEGPKKIEDLHRDAAQERHAQSARLARTPSMGSSVRRGQPMEFSPRGRSMLPSPNDDDKWNNFPGQLMSGRDMRVDNIHGPNAVGFRPNQSGNYGVLRNPRMQAPIQYPASIFSGPIPNLGPQIVVPRNNADSDRWLRGTSFQKGLMPSPQTPLQMMHKTDKYEVGKVSDEEQAKQRQLKAILNKLTPQNFEKLFEQVKQVNIDNVVTLTGVISRIFDKALMEPMFCEMYANFFHHLSQELPDLSVDNQKITFKRYLSNMCQEEFERGEREQEEANKADDEGTVKQTEAEREEKRLKARRRMLGNIRLIGELYKKKMFTERVMHECIKKLLGQYQNPDEEDVEALCKLMSTIGEMIDHPKAKEHMDVYFDMMSKLSNNMKLSSRVRFMLKDSIDLRRNKWQQRRKVEVT